MQEAIAQLAQKAKAAKVAVAKSQPAEESNSEEEQEAEEEVLLAQFFIAGIEVICWTVGLFVFKGKELGGFDSALNGKIVHYH